MFESHVFCLYFDSLGGNDDDPSKQFKCHVSGCGKGFRTQKGLTTHQSENHTGNSKKISLKLSPN